jgi:plasmid stability protein
MHNEGMATIQVRDVGDDTLHTLKVRAARSGQSLQAYVRCMLDQQAATLSPEELESEVRDIAAHSDVTGDDVLESIADMRRARE